MHTDVGDDPWGMYRNDTAITDIDLSRGCYQNHLTRLVVVEISH